MGHTHGHTAVDTRRAHLNLAKDTERKHTAGGGGQLPVTIEQVRQVRDCTYGLLIVMLDQNLLRFFTIEFKPSTLLIYVHSL